MKKLYSSALNPAFCGKGALLRRFCAAFLTITILFSAVPCAFGESDYETYLSMFFSEATMEEGRTCGYTERFFSNIAAISITDLSDQDFRLQLSSAVKNGYNYRVFVMHEKGMPATDLTMLYCFQDSSWILKDTTSINKSIYLDASWEVLQGLNFALQQQELINMLPGDFDDCYECDASYVWQIYMEFTLYVEKVEKARNQITSGAVDSIPPLPQEIEDWPLDLPISVQLSTDLNILDVYFTAEPADRAAPTVAEVPETMRFEGVVNAGNLVTATLRFWEAGLHLVRMVVTVSIDGVKSGIIHRINIDTSNVESSSPLSEEEKSLKIREFVVRCYQYALGREGDENEISYWTEIVTKNGGTVTDIAYGILASDEFRNHGFGNQELVSILYRIYFNREPDEAGLNYWKEMLDSGVSLDVIMKGFSESEEFRAMMRSPVTEDPDGTSQLLLSGSELMNNHEHVYSVIISERFRYAVDPDDPEKHYITSGEIEYQCAVCGDTKIETNLVSHSESEKHIFRNGRCTVCGYTNDDAAEEAGYFAHLISLIDSDENLMDNGVIAFLHTHYRKYKVPNDVIQKIISVLKKASSEEATEKYLKLYLLSVLNYGINPEYEKQPGRYNHNFDVNAIELHPDDVKNMSAFFHESGHAVELNTMYDGRFSASFKQNGIVRYIDESQEVFTERVYYALRNDVKTKILKTIDSVSSSCSDEEKEIIAAAFMNPESIIEFPFLNDLNNIFNDFFNIKAHRLVNANEKLKKIYIDTKNKLKSEISDADKINNPAINSFMVPDAFQIATNRKISTWSGHPRDYGIIRQDDGFITYDNFLGAEAWAEFFSAKINNDLYNIETNEEWLPETTALLEEYADYLLDYYYDYYKNVYDYGVH